MEASNRTLRLPGCDEQTFRLFLYHLAKNKLPDYIYDTKEEPSKEQIVASRAEFQTGLVKLWTFGDAYLMPELQIAAMKHLIDHVRYEYFTVEAVETAFAAAKDGVLRDLFIRQMIQDIEGLEGNYDGDMTRFGAVPGFFQAFMEQSCRCRSKE